MAGKKKAEHQEQPAPDQHAEQSTTPNHAEGIQKLQAEKQELVEHLQRLQAEFDNYRKRIEREREEHKALATDRLLREILPVLDNFHLALEHAKDTEGNLRGDELLSGIIMVKEQLQHLLHDYGIEELPREGSFDPAKHEALMTTEQEGVPAGTIIQTFQRGYVRNGKVIRPAKVSVAR